MNIEQKIWDKEKGWYVLKTSLGDRQADLVFAFGSKTNLCSRDRFDEIRVSYPHAHIIYSSASGEIASDKIIDDKIVTTALSFSKTKFKVIKELVKESEESFRVGTLLSKRLQAEDLKHILVISDGIKVNGSELVKGLNDAKAPNVSVTGGLASDNAEFNKTLVGYNEMPCEGLVVAVGFYGDALKVGYASFGGWDTFGPERRVTSSRKNVLYELDNQSALGLYKKYLGSLSAELPGSALLFPLAIRQNENKMLVRTVVSVDETNQSMTFAGDIPLNASVRLMRANFDRLIEAGGKAASESKIYLRNSEAELAIFISCVGRRMVLSHRAEDEVVEAAKLFNEDTFISGFYSNGEISPFSNSCNCELHNQTMTITTFSER